MLRSSLLCVERRKAELSLAIDQCSLGREAFEEALDVKAADLKSEVDAQVNREKARVGEKTRGYCVPLLRQRTEAERDMGDILAAIQTVQRHVEENGRSRRPSDDEALLPDELEIELDQFNSYPQNYESIHALDFGSLPEWKLLLDITKRLTRPQSSKARKHKRCEDDGWVYDDTEGEWTYPVRRENQFSSRPHSAKGQRCDRGTNMPMRHEAPMATVVHESTFSDESSYVYNDEPGSSDAHAEDDDRVFWAQVPVPARTPVVASGERPMPRGGRSKNNENKNMPTVTARMRVQGQYPPRTPSGKGTAEWCKGLGRPFNNDDSAYEEEEVNERNGSRMQWNDEYHDDFRSRNRDGNGMGYIKTKREMTQEMLSRSDTRDAQMNGAKQVGGTRIESTIGRDESRLHRSFPGALQSKSTNTQRTQRYRLGVALHHKTTDSRGPRLLPTNEQTTNQQKMVHTDRGNFVGGAMREEYDEVVDLTEDEDDEDDEVLEEDDRPRQGAIGGRSPTSHRTVGSACVPQPDRRQPPQEAVVDEVNHHCLPRTPGKNKDQEKIIGIDEVSRSGTPVARVRQYKDATPACTSRSSPVAEKSPTPIQHLSREPNSNFGTQNRILCPHTRTPGRAAATQTTECLRPEHEHSSARRREDADDRSVSRVADNHHLRVPGGSAWQRHPGNVILATPGAPGGALERNAPSSWQRHQPPWRSVSAHPPRNRCQKHGGEWAEDPFLASKQRGALEHGKEGDGDPESMEPVVGLKAQSMEQEPMEQRGCREGVYPESNRSSPDARDVDRIRECDEDFYLTRDRDVDELTRNRSQIFCTRYHTEDIRADADANADADADDQYKRERRTNTGPPTTLMTAQKRERLIRRKARLLEYEREYIEAEKLWEEDERKGRRMAEQHVRGKEWVLPYTFHASSSSRRRASDESEAEKLWDEEESKRRRRISEGKMNGTTTSSTRSRRGEENGWCARNPSTSIRRDGLMYHQYHPQKNEKNEGENACATHKQGGKVRPQSSKERKHKRCEEEDGWVYEDVQDGATHMNGPEWMCAAYEMKSSTPMESRARANPSASSSARANAMDFGRGNKITCPPRVDEEECETRSLEHTEALEESAFADPPEPRWRRPEEHRLKRRTPCSVSLLHVAIEGESVPDISKLELRCYLSRAFDKEELLVALNTAATLNSNPPLCAPTEHEQGQAKEQEMSSSSGNQHSPAEAYTSTVITPCVSASAEHYFDVTLPSCRLTVEELLQDVSPQVQSYYSMPASKVSLYVKTHKEGTPMPISEGEQVMAMFDDWRSFSEAGWPRLFLLPFKL